MWKVKSDQFENIMVIGREHNALAIEQVSILQKNQYDNV